MGLLSFFGGKEDIKGEIGYFGLAEWWLSEFTKTERDYIATVYQPLGSGENSLINDDIGFTNQTVVGVLGCLAGWFAKNEDRPLAYRIIDKAESLIDYHTKPLDEHFLFQTKIEILYRDRDQPGGLDKAIAACRQQIDFAPRAAAAFTSEHPGALPEHKGFKQYAIILEKQKLFGEAVELCAEAARQGWSGEWDKRIARCNRKADR